MNGYTFQLMGRNGVELTALTALDASTDDEAIAEVRAMVRDTDFDDDVVSIMVFSENDTRAPGLNINIATIDID